MQIPKTHNKHDLLDPNWDLVWADEFDSNELDTKNWNRQIVEAGRFNDEWQRYTDAPRNAYIENSKLIIKAIHESDQHGANQYSSARINTSLKQNWCHGKIAAKIQLPHGNGIWPAFWMLGANCEENGGDTAWPICGEIDILELYGSKDDAVIEANFHYADHLNNHQMLSPPEEFRLTSGKFSDQFHVFAIEWTENEICWFIDDYCYARKSINDSEFSALHQEFFILLNIAVGGEWAGRPDITTQLPQVMIIDWIRVYQKRSD